jgi:aquaporin Z
MLSGVFAWKFLWVYLIAQVLGAVVAAYAYKATTLDEHTSASRRG